MEQRRSFYAIFFSVTLHKRTVTSYIYLTTQECANRATLIARVFLNNAILNQCRFRRIFCLILVLLLAQFLGNRKNCRNGMLHSRTKDNTAACSRHVLRKEDMWLSYCCTLYKARHQQSVQIM